MNYDLCNLLKKKLDAFRAFLSATIALKELTESQSGMEAIESLMEKRESCIGAIDDIDSRINKIRKESPSFISAIPGEERKIVREIAGEIDDIALKAANMNQEFEKTLRLRHDDIKNQMAHIRHAKGGVRSYIRKGYGMPEPRFLNVRL